MITLVLHISLDYTNSNSVLYILVISRVYNNSVALRCLAEAGLGPTHGPNFPIFMPQERGGNDFLFATGGGSGGQTT